MSMRDEQKEKRREEILLAGLTLFATKGYASTKTSDIAQAVNMSGGLLFHYFPTKEALYETLIHIGLEHSQQWMEHSADHPLAYFTDVVQQILTMIRETPERAQYFILIAQALRSATTPEPLLQMLSAVQESRYTKTVALIRAGQQTGELRSGDPDALACAFWCSIQGIAEQLAVHPQTPFPAAEWIVDILRNPAQKGRVPS